MFPSPPNESAAAPATPEALTPLVVILGPTASGKSTLAVSLAERFGGEVLACDSTQVYRGFDIGTAKPTLEERRGIPHHLIDIVEPSAVFTAGEYRRQALNVLADLRSRNRLPILTAGTGLYLRALLEGLAEAPKRSDALRARLQESAAHHGGNQYLHRMLGRLDPVTAARILPNDRQKLIRALEICLLAGKPVADVHRAGRWPLVGYSILKLGLNPPRAALYNRIGRRVQQMLDQGWLDEVAALIRNGTPLSAKPFEFLGYRELRDHLEEGTPSPKVIEAIAQDTRRYAKRQFTWFRREAAVEWLPGFGDDESILKAARSVIEAQFPALAGTCTSHSGQLA